MKSFKKKGAPIFENILEITLKWYIFTNILTQKSEKNKKKVDGDFQKWTNFHFGKTGNLKKVFKKKRKKRFTCKW